MPQCILVCKALQEQKLAKGTALLQPFPHALHTYEVLGKNRLNNNHPGIIICKASYSLKADN